MMVTTEIAAHRGGAGLWPENSAAAFRGAAGLDVEQIEFDVQLTADGEPVIFHDGTLERMTDGRGPLAERTLAELRALEIAGDGGRILTLDEGLDLLDGSSLSLRCEFKTDHRLVPYPGLVELVVARLGARELLPRTIFTSFHLPSLRAVGALGLPIRGTVWLVTRQAVSYLGPDALGVLARHADVGSIALHQRLLDDDTVERLHRSGLAISTFGALEEATIERILRQGVAVLTTDRPDVALRVRERLSGA